MKTNLLSCLTEKYVRSLNQNHISIQSIFKDYWDGLYALHHQNIRSSIVKNVRKMIDCKDLSKGYLFYECTSCDQYHMTGLSCHSRFCPSCGHKYRDERSLEIQKKLIDAPHRHFVFSIPFDIRPYFWRCRALFDCLFQSVNEALTKAIRNSKADKKNDVRLGFISFLHTSGRSLNLHPHLHVLLAEKKVDRNGKMKNIFYFPFARLRKTFMFVFLKNASNAIKLSGDDKLYKSFNILRTKIVKTYQDGFYTYGPKIKEKQKLSGLKKIADYIARYASHPPIAESNILYLNHETETITWQYTDHKDHKVIKVEEHVYKFIAKLIPHILDDKFHQIRYYGFYANRTKRVKDAQKLVCEKTIQHSKHNLKWRILIMMNFKFDPLMCHCGSKMVLNLNSSYLLLMLV